MPVSHIPYKNGDLHSLQPRIPSPHMLDAKLPRGVLSTDKDKEEIVRIEMCPVKDRTKIKQQAL